MNRIKIFLTELEEEALTTRKMLERVPTEKFDWQPHTKSMTLKRLATHVAELPSWIAMTINTDELDFAVNSYQPVEITQTEGLLTYFENNMIEARSVLIDKNEIVLDEPWTMRSGEEIYSTRSKAEVIRMSISQTIHHRAQLGVYLRLLDIPIPGSYGPSADEISF
ncbi:DinB family protein [Pedobacter sp. JCM 36344]|uniref:DinB family protein n=1 Tax=Pedobacter sp. JCM 36344 TaxID=3374280 RepID=UPI00397DF321